MRNDKEHLGDVLIHKDHVLENCIKLGNALIDRGDVKMGRKLIARGYSHDNSKLSGVQWLYLRIGADTESKEFQMALREHITTEDHHPESHENIHKMTDLAVAEMMCDLKARSGEFSTDLQEYIDKVFLVQHGFTKSDPVYQKMMEFKALLCEQPFKRK